MPIRIQQKLDEPITQHMRSDFPCLIVQQTVGEALDAIRKGQFEGTIIYFYVVDEQQQIRGVVPTRRLLLSPLDKQIGEIMLREVIAVPQTATVLEACEFFTLHRLLAFPVVDERRRVVGVIDVELYTSELDDLDRSARNDDLFQLIGVQLAEAQQTSPLVAFRSRFPWLLTNIVGGIAAAFLSGAFQAQLQRAVALALFIPVVLALSESVSIQSVTLALRVLHGRPPTLAGLLAKIRSEGVTGLLLGIASALVVGAVAHFWLHQPHIVWVLLGGIGGGVTCSAVIGLAAPNVLRLLRCDPHVACGPVALAISDVVTLLIYLSLARRLL